MSHRDRVCRSLQITEDQSVGQSERLIGLSSFLQFLIIVRVRKQFQLIHILQAFKSLPMEHIQPPLTILVQTRSLEAASDSRGPAVEVPYVTPPKSDMQRNGNIGVLRQSTTIKI
ncbi:hypothetical protein Tco_0271244 [Tanacetum coccineum]